MAVQTFALRSQVTDASGTPIVGATVTVTPIPAFTAARSDSDGNIVETAGVVTSASTTTNAQGQFSLSIYANRVDRPRDYYRVEIVRANGVTIMRRNFRMPQFPASLYAQTPETASAAVLKPVDTPGLTQVEVDARIDDKVERWAIKANTDRIPAGRLGSGAGADPRKVLHADGSWKDPSFTPTDNTILDRSVLATSDSIEVDERTLRFTGADARTYIEIETPGITIEDEGSVLGDTSTVETIDFKGAGVSATRSGNKVDVTITGTAGVTTTQVENLIAQEVEDWAEVDKSVQIPISKLNISGTADGTKFLRDDGSWEDVPAAGLDTTAVDARADARIRALIDIVGYARNTFRDEVFGAFESDTWETMVGGMVAPQLFDPAPTSGLAALVYAATYTAPADESSVFIVIRIPTSRKSDIGSIRILAGSTPITDLTHIQDVSTEAYYRNTTAVDVKNGDVIAVQEFDKFELNPDKIAPFDARLLTNTPADTSIQSWAKDTTTQIPANKLSLSPNQLPTTGRTSGEFLKLDGTLNPSWENIVDTDVAGFPTSADKTNADVGQVLALKAGKTDYELITVTAPMGGLSASQVDARADARIAAEIDKVGYARNDERTEVFEAFDGNAWQFAGTRPNSEFPFVSALQSTANPSGYASLAYTAHNMTGTRTTGQYAIVRVPVAITDVAPYRFSIGEDTADSTPFFTVSLGDASVTELTADSNWRYFSVPVADKPAGMSWYVEILTPFQLDPDRVGALDPRLLTRAPAPTQAQVYTRAKDILVAGTNIHLVPDDTDDEIRIVGTVGSASVLSGDTFPAAPTTGEHFELLTQQTVARPAIVVPVQTASEYGFGTTVSYREPFGVIDLPAPGIGGVIWSTATAPNTLLQRRIAVIVSGTNTNVPISIVIGGTTHALTQTSTTFSHIYRSAVVANPFTVGTATSVQINYRGGTKVFPDKLYSAPHVYAWDGFVWKKAASLTGEDIRDLLSALPSTPTDQRLPASAIRGIEASRFARTVHHGSGTGLAITNTNSDRRSNVILFDPTFDLSTAGQGEIVVEATVSIGTRSATTVGFGTDHATTHRFGDIIFASTLAGTPDYDAGSAPNAGTRVGNTVDFYSGATKLGYLELRLVHNSSDQAGYILVYDGAGSASANLTLAINLEVAFSPTDSQQVTLPPAVTQTEAEAGTVTATRLWSPQRVSQAITALAPSGGGGGSTNLSGLTDVTLSSSILNNQALTYDDADSMWKNRTLMFSDEMSVRFADNTSRSFSAVGNTTGTPTINAVVLSTITLTPDMMSLAKSNFWTGNFTINIDLSLSSANNVWIAFGVRAVGSTESRGGITRIGLSSTTFTNYNRQGTFFIDPTQTRYEVVLYATNYFNTSAITVTRRNVSIALQAQPFHNFGIFNSGIPSVVSIAPGATATRVPVMGNAEMNAVIFNVGRASQFNDNITWQAAGAYRGWYGVGANANFSIDVVLSRRSGATNARSDVATIRTIETNISRVIRGNYQRFDFFRLPVNILRNFLVANDVRLDLLVKHDSSSPINFISSGWQLDVMLVPRTVQADWNSASTDDRYIRNKPPYYKGAWSAGIYSIGDTVLHASNFYMCLVARTASDTSNPATDTSSWKNISQAGGGGGLDETAVKAEIKTWAQADNPSTRVPTAQMGSGTPSTTTFLRGDGSWQTLPTPVRIVTDTPDADVTLTATAASTWLTTDTTLVTLPAITAAQAGIVHIIASVDGALTYPTTSTSGGDRIFIRARIVCRRGSTDTIVAENIFYMRNGGNFAPSTTSAIVVATRQVKQQLISNHVSQAGDVYRFDINMIAQQVSTGQGVSGSPNRVVTISDSSSLEILSW